MAIGPHSQDIFAALMLPKANSLGRSWPALNEESEFL
ncbi:MAG: hypothetical protein RL571_824 [Pseudomonadota bacterium]|jgi:hypothetical protein